MKSTDLPTLLNDFFNSGHCQCVLIDGPWGSGKTFQVVKYRAMDENKNKMFYISLFGLESIDEINTAIYYSLHKNVKRITMVSKALAAVDCSMAIGGGPISASFSANAGKTMQAALSLIPKEIRSKGIIVLDDIERVSNKVSFLDLMGYINNLRRSGLKILCICATDEIEGANRTDANRASQFKTFQEKVFDRIIKINKDDEAIFDEVFKELEIKNANAYYGDFNQNIRKAIKVATFCSTVFEKIENEGDHRLDDTAKLAIFRASIAVVDSVFEEHKDNKSVNKAAMKFPSFYSDYGKSIDAGLKAHYLNFMQENENSVVVAYLKPLASAFLYDEFETLLSLFEPTEKNKAKTSQLLGPFFLSDDNKHKFAEEFFEKIHTKKSLSADQCERSLIDIIRYTNYIPTDEQISETIYFLLSNENDKQANLLGLKTESLFDDAVTPNIDELRKKQLERWKNEIKVQKEAIILDRFKKAVKVKDYIAFSAIVDDVVRDKASPAFKSIRNYLLEDGFHLPPLDGDLENEDWDFAHEIASAACKMHLEQDMKNYFVTLYLKNPNNYSLLERVNALARYKLQDPSFDASANQREKDSTD